MVASGVPADEAIELSKLNASLTELMQLSKKDEFNQQDVWLMLRSSLMDSASSTRTER